MRSRPSIPGRVALHPGQLPHPRSAAPAADTVREATVSRGSNGKPAGDRAIVLCFDEKTQVQTLDRTRAALPTSLGHAEGHTNDQIRGGRTPPLAALDVVTGQVIAQCRERHRHKERLSFLHLVDRETTARCRTQVSSGKPLGANVRTRGRNRLRRGIAHRHKVSDSNCGPRE